MQAAVKRLRRSDALLVALCFGSGVLSAFFLNDTVALMFTPLVLRLTMTLGRKPVPYLIALAVSANVGSAATITGNPQNLIVGLASGISYLAFMKALAPVALVGLVIVVGVMLLSYPDEFRSTRVRLEAVTFETTPPKRRKLIVVGLVTLGMLTAFLLGVPVTLAALAAAALLLLVGGLSPERVLSQVDWNLLIRDRKVVLG